MRFYKGSLTRRLILDTSIDNELEESIVIQLRVRCRAAGEWKGHFSHSYQDVGMPAEFIIKLQQMFKDLKLNRDMNEEFRTVCPSSRNNNTMMGKHYTCRYETLSLICISMMFRFLLIQNTQCCGVASSGRQDRRLSPGADRRCSTRNRRILQEETFRKKANLAPYRLQRPGKPLSQRGRKKWTRLDGNSLWFIAVNIRFQSRQVRFRCLHSASLGALRLESSAGQQIELRRIETSDEYPRNWAEENPLVTGIIRQVETAIDLLRTPRGILSTSERVQFILDQLWFHDYPRWQSANTRTHQYDSTSSAEYRKRTGRREWRNHVLTRWTNERSDCTNHENATTDEQCPIADGTDRDSEEYVRSIEEAHQGNDRMADRSPIHGPIWCEHFRICLCRLTVSILFFCTVSALVNEFFSCSFLGKYVFFFIWTVIMETVSSLPLVHSLRSVDYISSSLPVLNISRSAHAMLLILFFCSSSHTCLFFDVTSPNIKIESQVIWNTFSKHEKKELEVVRCSFYCTFIRDHSFSARNSFRGVR